MSTDVIVDQKYDTIIVDESPENTILVENTTTTIVTDGIQSLSEANDVDFTALEDGSLLVYSQTTQKWTATKLLESQNIESGHY